MRPLAIAGLAALIGGAAAALVARPIRYEVEGLSMAPALLPGDVVSTGLFPAVGRRRSPRRFERWLIEPPAGGTALKRVVGLPGERVAIAAGDLAIDGRVVLKDPRLLAEVGSVVAADDVCSDPPAAVLDDAAFAPHERRWLLPVRDVGLAAVVSVSSASPADPVRVRARVGQRRVTWRVRRPGHVAIAAGRLDGHVVAAAWPVAGRGAGGRSCLPPDPPADWDHRTAWTDDDPVGPAPLVSLALVAEPAGRGRAAVGELRGWRDVLLRPAADGRQDWTLAAGEHLVLGDFPSGSRDSRQWGPLGPDAFRHRVAATR